MQCKVLPLHLSIRAWKYLEFVLLGFLVYVVCFMLFSCRRERMPLMPSVRDGLASASSASPVSRNFGGALCSVVMGQKR